MSLGLTSIQTAKDDDQLFERLSEALKEIFPPELQEDRNRFLLALQGAPRGLRAMAGIFDLDVSMAMDDLAWHFGNHNDERFLQETLESLRELEADDAADLFSKAWDIAKPYLPEIRSKDWESEDPHDYFERTIQGQVDPLNEKMWEICKQCGKLGLLQYWLPYARKYPERCVSVR
jgi:AcrR family transcriptional regulator